MVVAVEIVGGGAVAGVGGDACGDEGVHSVHPEQDHALPAA